MLSRSGLLIAVIFALVVSVLTGGWLYITGIPADHNQWASFGTYVGGVMTPLTILAAVLALIQRDREHRFEMERLAKQGHKIDLLRFIEKIEADIDSTLSQITITVVVEDKQVDHPCKDVLFKISFLEWGQAIPTKEEILARADQSDGGLGRYDEKIILFETFSMIAAYINRLREHCDEYDKAAGNNVTGLYFARKYKVATERLNAKNYEVPVWKLGTQQSVPTDTVKAPRR